jgi:hypothetical protein
MKKIITTYANGKINLQVFTSVDGKTFYYSGIGRFCNTLLEAKLNLTKL